MNIADIFKNKIIEQMETEIQKTNIKELNNNAAFINAQDIKNSFINNFLYDLNKRNTQLLSIFDKKNKFDEISLIPLNQENEQIMNLNTPCTSFLIEGVSYIYDEVTNYPIDKFTEELYIIPLSSTEKEKIDTVFNEQILKYYNTDDITNNINYKNLLDEIIDDLKRGTKNDEILKFIEGKINGQQSNLLR